MIQPSVNVTPIQITKPPKRILIIKPSAIGDIVHALPVLNLVRKRWPEAQISWLVTPVCAALVENHPQIDQVIYFDRRGMSNAWWNPISALKLLGLNDDIRSQKFDLVLDLQGLFRSGWFTSRTGSPMRIGFTNSREFAWLFYTHKAEASWADHAVVRYLCMAKALGLDTSVVEFHFAVTDNDRTEIAQRLGNSDPYAVLLPGANWETKRWPAEHFAALVEPLQSRFGLRSIIAGGNGDKALAAQIPGALDLTGKTNIRQLVALLEGARLVIAGDTGPMHIAAALGKPLVTMYGPTDPILTGPFGRMDTVIRLDIQCSPCFSRTCSHQSCLRWLGIEPVLKLAEKQLSKSSVAMASQP